MSHGDHVTRLPTGYVGIASSQNAEIAGMSDGRRFGIQFHPEVVHTPLGRDLLRNFLVNICSCQTDWTAEHFIDSAIRQIRTGRRWTGSARSQRRSRFFVGGRPHPPRDRGSLDTGLC